MSITTRKQIVAVVVAVFAVLPALAQIRTDREWTYGEWTYKESVLESVDDFSGETTRHVVCAATASGDEIEISLTGRSFSAEVPGPTPNFVSLRQYRRDDSPFTSGFVRFIWDGGAVESQNFRNGLGAWLGFTPNLYTDDRSIVSKLMRHSHLRLEVRVEPRPTRIIDEISLSGSSRAIRRVLSSCR